MALVLVVVGLLCGFSAGVAAALVSWRRAAADDATRPRRWVLESAPSGAAPSTDRPAHRVAAQPRRTFRRIARTAPPNIAAGIEAAPVAQRAEAPIAAIAAVPVTALAGGAPVRRMRGRVSRAPDAICHFCGQPFAVGTHEH